MKQYGSVFYSQHTHGGSELPVTSVPIPSQTLDKQACGTQTCIQEKHPNT